MSLEVLSDIYMKDKRLATIFAVVFVDLLGFSLILPLLPYYAEKYGATPAVVGLLVASYALAQLIGAPLLGRLSDRTPAPGSAGQHRRHGVRFPAVGFRRGHRCAVRRLQCGRPRRIVLKSHHRRPDRRQSVRGAGVHHRRHRRQEPRQVAGHDRRGVRTRLHHRAGDRRRAEPVGLCLAHVRRRRVGDR